MKREDLFTIIQQIEDPEYDYQKILANVHYTHFFLMDRYKKLLQPFDLTPTQANLLGIINHFCPKPVSLEEIKSMVLEPNSDVSRTVSRLASKELVSKVTDEENRRKIAVVITPKGIKLLKEIQDHAMFKKFTAGLQLEDIQLFIKVLTNLRKSENIEPS